MPKKCKECNTIPSYGKADGDKKDVEYCKKHSPPEYVDVVSKRCKHPNCNTRPVYGKPGGAKKDAEYCKKHSPSEYVDVVNKRCKHTNCNTRAGYGKPGSTRKDTEYCKKHSPSEYVNVVSKRCKHPNCSTLPSYGKSGGAKKDAEYCKKHSPAEYVNVVSKRCIYPDCNTISNYNYVGFPAKYCASHAKQGMVYNPLKKCCECGKMASFGYERNFYCDTHNVEGSIDLQNVCYLCMQVMVPEQGMECKYCQEYDGKTVKRKEKETKIYNSLLKENLQVESYDKIVKGGCSKSRPDFIICTSWGAIVLEVDEFQHNRKNYTCECEVTRMKKIYFDIGVENLLFIRYNPDNYEPSYGKVFSENKRFEYLVKKLKKYIETRPMYFCTVVYLFYDGFTELDAEEEVLDPYSDDSFYMVCEKCRKTIPFTYLNREEMVCKYCI